MVKKKIVLKSQQEQINFVKIASKFDCDITLNKGRGAVDAKSMLGVASMDTTSDCYVQIHSEDTTTIDKLLSELDKYLLS